MLGRMMRAVDFELVLAAPARARSTHFAAHHVAQAPLARAKPTTRSLEGQLSTGDQEVCTQPVDEQPQTAPDRCWFGAVLPKRHARKATTRNLLRRQIRAAMDRHHPGLPRGLWLVRLRAPFDAGQYRSASSDRLREVARSELDGLLSRAVA
jgi:ribonuclease P protein component